MNRTLAPFAAGVILQADIAAAGVCTGGTGGASNQFFRLKNRSHLHEGYIPAF
jgi:hypothetical protein